MAWPDCSEWLQQPERDVQREDDADHGDDCHGHREEDKSHQHSELARDVDDVRASCP